MIEGEGRRVKCLTRSSARVFVDRSIGTLAIDRIATEQVSIFRKMDPDLVGPAGFQLAFDQAIGADFFDRPDMSDRMLFGWVGCLDTRGF